MTQFVGDHLVSERQTVAFARQPPYWLDVEELEKATATTPTAHNVAALAAAADLYRGDFLEGFYVQEAPEFEQWVLTERTRLRTHALQLLHTLARYHTAQGDLAQAMEYTRRILQWEPWHEEAHRQRMLLLAQNGQRSAALAQYELCRQALHSELNVEPDAATVELVAQIRAGKIDRVTSDKAVNNLAINNPVASDLSVTPAPVPVTLAPPSVTAPPAAPSVPHNLPGQRTPFVGRAAELADLLRLLLTEEDCRLLSLIGPGGMGKTRLALKAAEQIATTPTQALRFPDGIFFVPLENVSDANGLVSALISAISETSGFPLHVDAPLPDQLTHFLHTKAMLVILDNFEHLVAEATLLSDLLLAAPQLKLLVTSRETLGLQEAWFYPIVGLTLPYEQLAETPQADEADAVRLFVQCARRTRPDFALETERSLVLRICRLVEGMPLGIELAAAWLKVMTCTQIAQEVARGLDFLTARYQNLPARHRSMRAVLDSSWALLAPAERAIAARLAVFRGAFSPEAATEIAGASLFTLATLVEKALLRVQMAGHYQMHELTRQYAAEQLGAAAELRNAHAGYYAGVVQQLGEQLFGPQSKAALGQLNLIADNVTSAWQWLLQSVEQGNPHPSAATWLGQLIPTLTESYYVQARFQEGQQRFLQAATTLRNAGWATTLPPLGVPAPAQRVFAQLQVRLGVLHYDLGQYAAVLQQIGGVLPSLQAWGNAEELSLALQMLGKANYRLGHRAEARAQLQQSFEYAQIANYPLGLAAALNNLSHLAEDDSDYGECERLLRQCLTIYEQMNYPFGIGTTLANLGHVYGLQGNHAQALHYSQLALALAEQEGEPVSKLLNLCQIADTKRAQGQQQAAVADYRQSLALAQQLGYPHGMIVNWNGLAQTYVDLADLASARRALLEALPIVHKAGMTNQLITLSLLGKVWAQQGKLESALQVMAFVVHQPAATLWLKQAAQRQFAELARAAPPTLVSQAQQWAAAQALPDVLTWATGALYHPVSGG